MSSRRGNPTATNGFFLENMSFKGVKFLKRSEGGRLFQENGEENLKKGANRPISAF
jgi:hypothetical protein